MPGVATLMITIGRERFNSLALILATIGQIIEWRVGSSPRRGGRNVSNDGCMSSWAPRRTFESKSRNLSGHPFHLLIARFRECHPEKKSKTTAAGRDSARVGQLCDEAQSTAHTNSSNHRDHGDHGAAIAESGGRSRSLGTAERLVLATKRGPDRPVRLAQKKAVIKHFRPRTKHG
jgi:hypothetical protein